MSTIYRRNSERISVADAKQLILNALPLELNAGRFLVKMGPDGKTISDIDMDSLAIVSAAEAHAPYLDSDFLELCNGLGFEPHMMFSPAIGGYRGPQDDNTYMLTHTEFVKLAEKYSLSVEIGTARPAPAQSAAEPAPVVKETAQERRARWLDMFEAEEKREKRGALQRLANSENVDRSNMKKDIDKARGARDTEKRAGGWTSQLVQDGKRPR